MKESKLGLLIEGKAVRRLSFNNPNASLQLFVTVLVMRSLKSMKGKSRCASFPFHIGPTSILSQALSAAKDLPRSTVTEPPALTALGAGRDKHGPQPVLDSCLAALGVVSYDKSV